MAWQPATPCVENLVFVVSPFPHHVNLGIANGAALEDHAGRLQGRGKIHKHVKLKSAAQVRDPDLEELMLRALSASRKRVHGDA